MDSAAKIPNFSHERIYKKQPNIVVDFMMAQPKVVATLSAGEVWQLVEDLWKPYPEDGAKEVNDDLIFACSQVLPTVSSTRAVQQTSQYLVDGGVITENLSRDAVRIDAAADQAGMRDGRPADAVLGIQEHKCA